MKKKINLAIGNLAFQSPDVLSNLLPHFLSMGLGGLEIAPTKQWGAWDQITLSDVKVFKNQLYDQGLVCPSLQSIFYGKEHLNFFSIEKEKEILNHLEKVCTIANCLEAKVLVFGSPKNRIAPNTFFDDNIHLVAERFSKVAELCKHCDVIFCLEANPKEYGCNFINTFEEALKAEQVVNHSHFKLVLDWGCLSFAPSLDFELIKRNIEKVKHIQVAEPFLRSLDKATLPHVNYAKCVQNSNYRGWLSIELLNQDETNICKSIGVVKNIYCI